VFCEAPLGRTVAEAEEMARAAGSLHTAIGLQGRLNPAVRRAAQLISSGKIGRPLNARTVSTNLGFGPELPSSHDYFNKTSSGANLLTINGGIHSIWWNRSWGRSSRLTPEPRFSGLLSN
jgi:predicted dehydrogenase